MPRRPMPRVLGGTLESVATVAGGAWHTTRTDPIVEATNSLKSQYGSGPVFVMSRRAGASIRRLKESTTIAYIWQPGLHAHRSHT